ncbi:MAG: universal stress protein [Halioglobus sp.]
MGKILIIADLQDKCSATPRGLELAHRLGHSAEVVAFTYAPLKRLKVANAEQSKIKQQLLAERERSIRERIDKYAKEGQKVSLKVIWQKDIHPWIVKRAATGYFAVVKTAHNTGTLTYTSTDWHLLRECAAPIMLVAEKKWSRTKPVLVALDLSTGNKAKQRLNHELIEAGKRLAVVLNAELRIISAIEVPTLLADLDLLDPLAYVKEQKEAMRPHLLELAEAHELPEKTFRFKRGPVDKVITSDAAKLRAQIVVLGTIGRRGVRARLIGNTAEAVLRHLKTDVLAVKP